MSNRDSNAASPEKIGVGYVICIIFASVAGIAGISALFSGEIIPALLLIVSAVVAAPTFSAFVQHKLGFAVTGTLKFVTVIGLLIAVGATIPKQTNSPTTEAATTSTSASTTSDAAVVQDQQQTVDLRVSSIELARAYQKNEVAALKTYAGDKVLEVSGTITAVSLSIFDEPVIEMKGVNQFLPVQATFDKSYSDQISKMSKGQRVTVRCSSIDSVMTAPQLKNCVLP